MNKGKSSGGNLKEDAFKNHQVLGPICNNLTKDLDNVLKKLEEDLVAFQVARVTPGYLGSVFIDKKGPLSKSASISVENRICKVVCHDKKIATSAQRAIEEQRHLTVSKSENILIITIPDPTTERREKIIKEMMDYVHRSTDQINSRRTDSIKQLDKIKKASEEHKKNAKKDKDKSTASNAVVVPEDELKSCEKVIEQIKHSRLEKLNRMADQQAADIRSGKK